MNFIFVILGIICLVLVLFLSFAVVMLKRIDKIASFLVSFASKEDWDRYQEMLNQETRRGNDDALARRLATIRNQSKPFSYKEIFRGMKGLFRNDI